MADAIEPYQDAIEYYRCGGRRQPITYNKTFVEMHPNETFREREDGRFYRVLESRETHHEESSRSHPLNSREVSGLQAWPIKTHRPVPCGKPGLTSTLEEPLPNVSGRESDCWPENTQALDSSRRRINGVYALQDQVWYGNTGRPLYQQHPERCTHDGACDQNCPCTLNETPCRLMCECAPNCERRFPPCNCDGPCVSCQCIFFDWACCARNLRLYQLRQLIRLLDDPETRSLEFHYSRRWQRSLRIRGHQRGSLFRRLHWPSGLAQ